MCGLRGIDTKKILFTGGGSAGHVTVNLALIPRFVEAGWTVDYIGSKNGIERQLVSSLPGVRYEGIATGKLRRYMDWENVKDPFRIVQGVWQAYRLIRRMRPNVVFSKGGFVSVPVVLGARLNRVPVMIHESDVTPGLANRIAIPFADGVCTTFPETGDRLPERKVHPAGPIIRDELRRGDAERGRVWCGLSTGKPVLLIMGGSLGARRINEAVRAALPSLTPAFQIVHLCGRGQLDDAIRAPGYRQYEYVQDELPDLLAMTDIVVSRAGANSIFEFLALRKPMLLVPLTKRQSRGDQLANAESFRRLGFSEVLPEENMTAETLAKEVARLYENRHAYLRKMAGFDPGDALSSVFELVCRMAKRS